VNTILNNRGFIEFFYILRSNFLFFSNDGIPGNGNIICLQLQLNSPFLQINLCIGIRGMYAIWFGLINRLKT